MKFHPKMAIMKISPSFPQGMDAPEESYSTSRPTYES